MNKRKKSQSRNRGRSLSKGQGRTKTGALETHDGLGDLFLHEMEDLYDAEKQLLKALPKMAKAARAKELKDAFKRHLEQTKKHVSRLEQAFKTFGEKPKSHPCDGMKGLIKEGDKTAKMWSEETVTDGGIIGAAQRVEHYEIAAYGTLCSLAEKMGEGRIASLLNQTLEEEQETDAELTEIAECVVTVGAVA